MLLRPHCWQLLRISWPCSHGACKPVVRFGGTRPHWSQAADQYFSCRHLALPWRGQLVPGLGSSSCRYRGFVRRLHLSGPDPIRVPRLFDAELQAPAEAIRLVQSSKLQPSVCCIQSSKLQAPAVGLLQSSKLKLQPLFAPPFFGPIKLIAAAACAQSPLAPGRASTTDLAKLVAGGNLSDVHRMNSRHACRVLFVGGSFTDRGGGATPVRSWSSAQAALSTPVTGSLRVKSVSQARATRSAVRAVSSCALLQRAGSSAVFPITPTASMTETWRPPLSFAGRRGLRRVQKTLRVPA